MPATKRINYNLRAVTKYGLSSSEAQRRLEKHGPNEIERRKPYSVPKLIISQFASPLIYILVMAGVVTWVLGEIVDSAVIWAAVGVNTFLLLPTDIQAHTTFQGYSSMTKQRECISRNIHMPN